MSSIAALDALKAGDLQQSLQALQQEIRKNPADAKRRVFLFQLLVVLEQWDRALNQLKVIAELDTNALPMVQTYREAIRCEALRRDVFAGKKSPIIFGEPEAWVVQLLEALRLAQAGDFSQAAQLREQAFETAPAVAGEVDGQAFAWLADADPRLGPVLELMSNGSYYWLPLHRVKQINIEAPTDLRDQVWMPVGVTLVNGGELIGFIPTRYAGTQGDDALLLARRTDWQEIAPDLYYGQGQRMFTTDTADYSLMDVRKISFAGD